MDFKSNLFKLQTDQIIKNLTPKNTTVEQCLFESILYITIVKSIIQDIKPTSLAIEQAMLNNPPFPYSPKKTLNYKLAFESPSKIAVVGSFLLNNSINATPNVDLAG
jgi:hypothetical protein